jgi:hypothetical protein
MAIAYPGGTVLKTTLDGTTKATLIAAMKTALETVGWTSTAISGGWSFNSATTPQGLAVQVRFVDDGSLYPALSVHDTTGATISANPPINTGTGTVFDFIASRYNFFLSLPGVTAPFGICF